MDEQEILASTVVHQEGGGGDGGVEGENEMTTVHINQEGQEVMIIGEDGSQVVQHIPGLIIQESDQGDIDRSSPVVIHIQQGEGESIEHVEHHPVVTTSEGHVSTQQHYAILQEGHDGQQVMILQEGQDPSEHMAILQGHGDTAGHVTILQEDLVMHPSEQVTVLHQDPNDPSQQLTILHQEGHHDPSSQPMILQQGPDGSEEVMILQEEGDSVHQTSVLQASEDQSGQVTVFTEENDHSAGHVVNVDIDPHGKELSSHDISVVEVSQPEETANQAHVAEESTHVLAESDGSKNEIAVLEDINDPHQSATVIDITEDKAKEQDTQVSQAKVSNVSKGPKTIVADYATLKALGLHSTTPSIKTRIVSKESIANKGVKRPLKEDLGVTVADGNQIPPARKKKKLKEPTEMVAIQPKPVAQESTPVTGSSSLVVNQQAQGTYVIQMPQGIQNQAQLMSLIQQSNLSSLVSQGSTVTTQETPLVISTSMPQNPTPSAKIDAGKSLIKESENEDVRSGIPRCDLCEVIFKKEAEMNLHFELEHMKSWPYQCMLCRKIFATKEENKKHLESEHTAKLHRCRGCQYVMPSKKVIKVHQEDHIGDESYHCDLCDVPVNSKGLEDHILDHHTSPEQYFCLFCDQKSSDKERMIQHMTHHAGDSIQTCRICTKRWGRRNIASHLDSHNWHNPNSCRECKEIFDDMETLKKHTIDNHMSKTNLVVCRWCNHTSEKKDEIVMHAIEEHTSTFTECAICYFSSDAESVKEHMSEHVSIIKRCNHCGLIVDTISSLHKHVVTHGKSPSKVSSKCVVCDIHYSSAKELLHHDCSDIKIDPAYGKCEVCSKVFPTTQSYLEHKAGHISVQFHVCRFCDQHLSDSDDLISHMQGHTTKNNPHRCFLCLQIIKDKSQLQVHVLNHFLSKSKECLLCDQTQPAGTDMKMHLIYHLVKRFYKCVFCQGDFASQGLLETHMTKHRVKVPSYFCSTCNKKFGRLDSLNDHVQRHMEQSLAKKTDDDKDDDFEDEDKPEQAKAPTVTLSKPAAKATPTVNIGMPALPQLAPQLTQLTPQITPQLTYIPNVGLVSIIPPVAQQPITLPTASPIAHMAYSTPMTTPLKTPTTPIGPIRLQSIQPKNLAPALQGTSLETSRTGKKSILKKPSKSPEEDKETEKCKICSKTFPDIAEHIKTHLEYRNFRCPKCDQVTSSKEQAKEHMVEEHLKTSWERFQCKVCAKISDTKEEILEHMKSHAQKESYRCKQCRETFSGSKLQEHLAKHSMDTKYQCAFCKTIMNDKRKIGVHMKAHGEKEMTCRFCKETVKKAQVPSHILKHDCAIPPSCGICLKDFEKLDELHDHLTEVHMVLQKNITCNVCNERFVNENKLYAHLVDEHSMMGKQCKMCLGVVEEEKLSEHVEKHLWRQNTCSHCKEELLTERELYLHMSKCLPELIELREEEKNDKDENDGKKEKDDEKEGEGMEVDNAGEDTDDAPEAEEDDDKPEKIDDKKEKFKCVMCDASFSTEEKLKEHTPTHLKDEPTKCQVCSLFVKGSELKDHVRGHLENTYYTCIMCLDLSSTEADLDKHYESHVIILPTFCKICNAQLTTIPMLQDHLKTHVKLGGASTQPSPKASTQTLSVNRLGPIQITGTTSSPLGASIPTLPLTGGNIIPALQAGQIPAGNLQLIQSLLAQEIVNQANKLVTTPQPQAKTTSYEIPKSFHPPPPPPSNVVVEFSSKMSKVSSCKICNKEFFSQKALKAHRKSCGNEAYNACDVCQKVYQSKELLGLHMKQHMKNFHYSCGVCNKKQVSKHFLSLHLRSHGGTGKNSICDVCMKGYLDNQVLNSHQCIPQEKSLLPFRFQTGGRTVKPTTGTEQKRARKKAKDKGKEGMSAKELADSKEKIYACGWCTVEFKTDNELMYHLSLCDKRGIDLPEPQIYQCGICYKIIGGDFEAHLTTHWGEDIQEGQILATQIVGTEGGIPDGGGQEDVDDNGDVDAGDHTYTEEGESVAASENQDGSEIMDGIKAEPSENGDHANISAEISNFLSRPPMPYKCYFCQDSFPNEDLLNEHFPSHDPGFRNPRHSLLLYLRRTKSGFVDVRPNHHCMYVCDSCGKKWENKYSLIKHIQTHLPDKPYKCRWCSKGFNRRDILADHELTHTKLRPFKCLHCPETFRKKSDLKEHTLSHGDDPSFICPECGKGFYARYRLNAHRFKVHGVEKKPKVKKEYVPTETEPNLCPHCPKTYKHKTDLDKHILYKHRDDVPVIMCEICGREYKNPNLLRLHMMVHQERKFECHICGAKIRTKSHLNHHMRVHTGTRDQACEICGKAFFTQTALRLHRMTHTGERPHKCEECGRAFRSNEMLRRHSVVHTEERPYNCPICNRLLKSERRLKDHLRRHNMPKTRIPCPLCNKIFSSKGSLKIHQKEVHEGHREVCQVCNAKFRRQLQLEQHMAEVHPEADFTPRPGRGALAIQQPITEVAESVGVPPQEEVVTIEVLNETGAEGVVFDGTIDSNTLYECGLCKDIITGDVHEHVMMHHASSLADGSLIIQTDGF